ncbi:18580_t:CDS:2, partial [Racocetra persica]
TSSQLVFEVGQVTYWNSRIIEYQTLPFKQPIDMKQRLNQGRLYVILHSVKPAVEGSDTYFYVKKGNSEFRSPYTIQRITTERDPFRPAEMPTRRILNISTPKIHSANPRKSTGFANIISNNDKE